MRTFSVVMALLAVAVLTAHDAQAVRGVAGTTSRVLGNEEVSAQAPVAGGGQVVRTPAQNDEGAVRALLQKVEQAARTGNAASYRALLLASADRTRAEAFIESELREGATRVVVQERDRVQLPGTLPGNGHRLTVDAFIEQGNRARVATWQLDFRKVADREWRIQDQEKVSGVESLFRLSINPLQQFAARDFTIKDEDLDLTLIEGSVFSVNADGRETGLVLVGRGQMRFRPGPETERGQVKILAGTDTLESSFDAAYIRAGSIDLHADTSQLTPQATDPREARRAEQIFREESSKALVLDLGDLSREDWSTLPSFGDFLAEIRTRRFSTLTYIRSGSDPEDVSLFDRRGQRNIALYASRENFVEHGPFFDEDESATYDVLDYNVETAFSPDRLWIDGKTQLRLRVHAPYAAQLNVRLADSLAVQYVYSSNFGRLFHLRAKGRDLIVVNLPVGITQGTEMILTIAYKGRLEPQPPDRETMLPGQGDGQPRRPPLLGAPMAIRADPTYLYSSRSYWYAQAPVSDYATATMRISVPASFGCVASGERSSQSPSVVRGEDGTTRNEYEFTAVRPLRYLAFVAGRFTRAGRTTVAFDSARPSDEPVGDGDRRVAPPPAAGHESLDLTVDASPFQVLRGRQLVERAADIVKFYQSVVGDSPYNTLTLALIESTLPGGHSPAYLATLNQPLQGLPITWQNDPAVFDGYPEFFLAHEIAHQWWGQAVGWRNYHEQWLSEGIAQYFAALYAQRYRGNETFASMMRQMRSSAVEWSPQGPVYLGYRLGQIEGNSRIFRALVYNKAAVVLHMLRRLIGDEAFFRGLRRFYSGSRYQKASTEDLRFAMEWESGVSLERFMERWVYGSTLPDLTFSYRVESSGGRQELVLQFEQVGDLFDVPIAVTIEYADRRVTDVSVPVTERSVEMRVPLDGALRSVNINNDDGAIANIRRAP